MPPGRRVHYRFKELALRLRCAIPFLRDLPVEIRSGPLAGRRWLPSPGDAPYIEGDYERETQAVFLKWIARGSVVYDVGAHRGFFSLLAAHLVGPQGRVVAFEPSGRNERLVRAHAALNGLTQISSYPYAISGENGTAEFSDLEDDMANTMIATSPRFAAAHRIQRVESRTLDDLVGTEAPAPQFIKMDIEGAELAALAGARRSLARHRPILYFSVHENHLPGVQRGCLELLAPLGYCMKLIQTNELTPGVEDYLAVPGLEV